MESYDKEDGDGRRRWTGAADGVVVRGRLRRGGAAGGGAAYTHRVHGPLVDVWKIYFRSPAITNNKKVPAQNTIYDKRY